MGTESLADSEITCPGGKLAVQRTGGPGVPAAICVPGLSANLRSFDRIVAALASAQQPVVAVDLRGRGRSEITPAGTYGWPAHVADVLAVADNFGASRFDWIGHSMGAFLGLLAAARHPDRIGRLVLIDAAGRPQASTLPAITRSLARLGGVHPSPETYLQRIRSDGAIRPWEPMWDAYFTRELEPFGDGVRVRTDATAIAEDAVFGATQDPAEFWPAVRAPSLLIRATEPMQEGAGLIVSDADAAAFRRVLPAASVVDVAANHYTVMTSPDAIHAVVDFLAVDAS